jgi:hypothetical protein
VSEHVPAHAIPRTGPQAPAEDDHPAGCAWGAGLTWALRLIPVELAWPDEAECPGGRHGAHCYTAARFEAEPPHHDIGYPEYDDAGRITWEDAAYVRRMAAAAGQLPALVLHPAGRIYGGGHRLAAWRDADWDHVPAWVPIEPQDAPPVTEATQVAPATILCNT